MFGFGSMSHLLVVLVLALILIGPKQLPEVARTLGRLFNELRRASNMFTHEFRSQLQQEDDYQRIQSRAEALQKAQETKTAPEPSRAENQTTTESEKKS
jgi:sec-independent protein translocase protein TatB